MAVQVPKSIKKIATEVKKFVKANNAMSLDDVPQSTVNRWESICNHEMFWQDCNRFIGDIYSESVTW